MSPTAFADSINVNRSSVTHIFSGRNQPSLDVAKKILNAFPEISSDWLILGTGSMLRGETSPSGDSPSLVSTQDSSRQLPRSSGSPQPDLFAALADVAPEDAAPSGSPVSVSDNKDRHPQSVSPEEPIDNTNAEEAVRPSKRTRPGETLIQDSLPKRERILKSHPDRQLVRVVFFYSDRTCEVYNPS